MKRLAWIPATLFAIAIPLFLVTGSVAWAFNNPGIYRDGFEKYSVSRSTGISEEELLRVASEIRHYFNSRDEPLAIRVRIYGAENDLFNQRELAHMRDVKRLVWGVYLAGALSGLYLVITTALAAVRHGRRFIETVARRALWGGGLTIALLAAVGLFAVVGFDTLFLKFHQLSFANDLWQLDPRTDILVVLFPQDFWFDATMWLATRAATGALAIAILSGSYLLYTRWAEQKRSRQAFEQLEKASELQ